MYVFVYIYSWLLRRVEFQPQTSNLKIRYSAIMHKIYNKHKLVGKEWDKSMRLHGFVFNWQMVLSLIDK